MDFIRKHLFSSYKRFIGVLTVAALALAIPITLTLINQQQDIRQRASYDAGCPQFSGPYANHCTNAPSCAQDAPYLYPYPGANADLACQGIDPNTGVFSGTKYGDRCCTNLNPNTALTPSPTPNLCPSGGQPVRCGGSAIICCPTSTDTCLYKTTLGYCCGSVCGNVSANPTSTPAPIPTIANPLPTLPQSSYAYCQNCPTNGQCGQKAYSTCNACKQALVWVYNCYGGVVSSGAFETDLSCNSQALCLPYNGATPTPVMIFKTPTPIPLTPTPTPIRQDPTPTPAPASYEGKSCDYNGYNAPFQCGTITGSGYSCTPQCYTAGCGGLGKCCPTGKLWDDFSKTCKVSLPTSIPLPTATGTASSLRCDLNKDKKISMLDYGMWSKEFSSNSPVVANGDCNSDGRVTMLDFGVFVNEFIDPKIPH